MEGNNKNEDNDSNDINDLDIETNEQVSDLIKDHNCSSNNTNSISSPTNGNTHSRNDKEDEKNEIHWIEYMDENIEDNISDNSISNPMDNEVKHSVYINESTDMLQKESVLSSHIKENRISETKDSMEKNLNKDKRKKKEKNDKYEKCEKCEIFEKCQMHKINKKDKINARENHIKDNPQDSSNTEKDLLIHEHNNDVEGNYIWTKKKGICITNECDNYRKVCNEKRQSALNINLNQEILYNNNSVSTSRNNNGMNYDNKNKEISITTNRRENKKEETKLKKSGNPNNSKNKHERNSEDTIRSSETNIDNLKSKKNKKNIKLNENSMTKDKVNKINQINQINTTSNDLTLCKNNKLQDVCAEYNNEKFEYSLESKMSSRGDKKEEHGSSNIIDEGNSNSANDHNAMPHTNDANDYNIKGTCDQTDFPYDQTDVSCDRIRCTSGKTCKKNEKKKVEKKMNTMDAHRMKANNRDDICYRLPLDEHTNEERENSSHEDKEVYEKVNIDKGEKIPNCNESMHKDKLIDDQKEKSTEHTYKQEKDEYLSLEEILYETTERAKIYNRTNYGLLGILKVIKMTNPNLNILALGTDLTTLGLDLNTRDFLFSSFNSPISDNPTNKDDYFIKPNSYLNTHFQIRLSLLLKLKTETLFYIFYNIPRDVLQAYAASELYIRKWLYHIIYKKWFTPKNLSNYSSIEKCASWIYFDPISWSKKNYEDFLNTQDIMNVEDVTKCIENIIKLQSYYNINQPEGDQNVNTGRTCSKDSTNMANPANSSPTPTPTNIQTHTQTHTQTYT
ncbi:CCR4-NOT transcription complex subunit 2, putative [Plasmodium malariae]|uniref:CCR4-NOT transcription complex subunit 2, putative n=1 Tax=Plasmodium malariae TaxID=5858 RepID=A0A1D3PBX1_PLAMA|nr:CCR4-NOT transcription complex subunit 2, putative [Plasmodium malariae]SCN12806.1 CCR4-NOT transcription complex subunit 2, putative [Plasmodium malariae]